MEGFGCVDNNITFIGDDPLKKGETKEEMTKKIKLQLS